MEDQTSWLDAAKFRTGQSVKFKNEAFEKEGSYGYRSHTTVGPHLIKEVLEHDGFGDGGIHHLLEGVVWTDTVSKPFISVPEGDLEVAEEKVGVYVFGDIAGEFDAFERLVARLVKPYRLILVGDLIDRGPKSKEIIDYCRAHPEIVVLKGNHEDMMLNSPGDWLYNGGKATLKSFGGKIPEDVKEWVEALPIKHLEEIDGKKFYISHAPLSDPDGERWHEEPVELWNRYPPVRHPDYFLQISGHNSKLEWFADKDGTFAVCIDDCRNKHLTALELPSLKVLHEPY